MLDNESNSSDAEGTFLTSLNADDLMLIQSAFLKASKLTDEEYMSRGKFCKILESTLLKGSTEDYSDLFDLIDISREGQISWDRFSNHLLLEFYERDDRIKATQIPQWQDLKPIPTPHKGFICSIMLSSPNRYCTVSKDGLLCIMNEKFELKRTCQVHTNPEVIRSKDLWITDAVLMSNVNKVVFSTTSRELWIYDLSSKTDFVCQYKIYGLKAIPLCVNYWTNRNNQRQSILAFGDTNGEIHVLFFSVANGILFDRPLKSDNNPDLCFPMQLKELIAGTHPSVSYLSYHAHTAWVRQVRYASLLDCFISCSTTSTDSIVLAWLGKARKGVRLTKVKIPLGVNCFDYQGKLNLIATAGIDNRICLWNPYVVSKPVGVLRGHMQSIVGVQFHHSKQQLISLSKDKVLRVWDVNMQLCLQRLTGVFPKGPDVNIFMFFDHERLNLLTSFNHTLVLLKMKTGVRDRIVSHEAAVTDVVYNSKFDQVVSVCERSSINVWILNTGQKIKHFSSAHDDAEITAVAVDHSQTRILTAGTDGIIKIWDINGNCHHDLIVENGTPCEIGEILCLNRMVLAFGWSKEICCFPTSEMKSYELYPINWKGKNQHCDDILVADFQEPRHLVTGSYDGDIVFWNTNTQNSTKKISEQRKRTKSRLLPPLTSPTNKQRPSSRLSRTASRNRQRVARATSINKLPEDNFPDSSSAVTAINFLKKRNSLEPYTADLCSCHFDGHVRFWNSSTCEKINEFKAFDYFGAVVSSIDSNNIYLGTGDESGMCKIWNINNYAINQQADFSYSSAGSVYNAPLLATSFKPHIDAITRIAFVEKKDNILILTASCDCSVALHHFDQLIGIFGQKTHWNLNDMLWDPPMIHTAGEMLVDESDLGNKHELENLLPTAVGDISESIQKTLHDLTPLTETASVSQTYTPEEDVHSEAWDRTVLGKTYQEVRKSKRNRKQPYELETISTSVSKDKQTRSYRCLETKEINTVCSFKKPDFVTHPEKYFLDSQDEVSASSELLPPTVDMLTLRHDEKSIFPKYILDMESRMKAAHKLVGSGQTVFSRLSESISRAGQSRSNYMFAKTPLKSNRWKNMIEGGTSVSSTSVTES